MHWGRPSGVCACVEGGIQGLWVESTWGHSLCREQTGSKGKQYMTARPTSFCRPAAEQRKHKATLSRKTVPRTPVGTSAPSFHRQDSPGYHRELPYNLLGALAASPV